MTLDIKVSGVVILFLCREHLNPFYPQGKVNASVSFPRIIPEVIQQRPA